MKFKNSRNVAKIIGLSLLLFFVTNLPVVRANAASLYAGDANTNVWYVSHVQDIGWQADVTNGDTSGTIGMVKNVEAVQIDVQDDASFSIEYTTNIAGLGWTAASRDGETSGTIGQNRPIINLCVAIKDKISKADSSAYDVYYRVHVRNLGWRSWVKNGSCANDSENEIEAIQVQIRKKGQTPIGDQISKQDNIVNEAKKHLGKPYVWGATGPNSFDCSGFTSYVYKNAAGINIGRTTYDQIKSGAAVTRAQLQAGDLVFTSANHVGIYIGDNKMIHAPQTGDVVKIANVYAFYAARRILN